MSFLNAYAQYLFRREVAILMTFRRRGRVRRLFIPAYWRATLLPLTVPLGYFLALFLDVPQSAALASGVFLMLGVFAAEFMLFQQNKMAWPIFQRVLKWSELAEFHQQAIGPLPSIQKPKEGDEESPTIPAQLKQMVLKGYLTARRNPPSFNAWVGRAPELRNIAFIVLIVVIFEATSLFTDETGIWLVGPMFFLGIQLRRVKMALDFILTWPLVERFVDWQAVYRDVGGVEEIEF